MPPPRGCTAWSKVTCCGRGTSPRSASRWRTTPRLGWPVSTDFLGLPGAVNGSDPDAGVPAHYGNPLREQRALAEGDAIVDLSHRSVLSISGPDRLGLLRSATGSAFTGQPGDSGELVLPSAT